MMLEEQVVGIIKIKIYFKINKMMGCMWSVCKKGESNDSIFSLNKQKDGMPFMTTRKTNRKDLEWNEGF